MKIDGYLFEATIPGGRRIFVMNAFASSKTRARKLMDGIQHRRLTKLKPLFADLVIKPVTIDIQDRMK